jgi:hypothetical protein
MHHNVRKQIRLGLAMHQAYGEYISNRANSNYDKYIQLKDAMKDYSPDPSARF